MVFRKPYAFLIKNFKKIHIVMLIMSIYVYLRLTSIISFMDDFITFGTYNKALEPFFGKTGFLFYLSLLGILIISILMIILLKKKQCLTFGKCANQLLTYG